MKLNNFIKPGKTVSLNGEPYRILVVTKQNVVLIRLDVEMYQFKILATAQLLVVNPKRIQEIDDTFGAIHINLTVQQKEEINEKQKYLEKILDEIYPDYSILRSNKTIQGIQEYRNRWEVTVKTVHKTIRRYLQSGRDEYSLVDQRLLRWVKENNNTQEQTSLLFMEREKHYEEAFSWFANGVYDNVRSAYQNMLMVYYSDTVIDEDGGTSIKLHENYPSEKMFRTYVNKRLGNQSIESFKKTKFEKENTDRIQYGTAQTGARYPGQIVEIDACEVIMALLADNSLDVIGKPVLYMAIDNCSLCIVGYYFGFENNSFLGATSLFTNLFFGEEQHPDENGKNITPGGIIPDMIRVDHGSEWVSQSLRMFGKECAIDISIVPPGQGSKKGMIESSFRSYQQGLRGIGKKYGVVSTEHGATPYDQAVMTIKYIRKTVENFIMWFNQDYKKSYTLEKKEILDGVRPIPYELWDYKIKNAGNPRVPTAATKMDYIFAMCVTCDKCSLSRKGITFNNLVYNSGDPAFKSLLEKNHYSKIEQIYEVRYDPRLVDYIWVKYENQVMMIPLSEKNEAQLTFRGLTWKEYLVFNQIRLDAMNDYAVKALENKLTRTSRDQSIMLQAKEERNAIPGKNNKKEIKTARLVQQQKERKQSALATFSDYSTETDKLIETKESEAISVSDTEKEWECVPQSYADWFKYGL